MAEEKIIFKAEVSVKDIGKFQDVFDLLASIFADERIDKEILEEYYNRLTVIAKDW